MTEDENFKSLYDRILRDVKKDLDDSIPVGIIMLWYSDETDVVPPGWAICDGNNGTPNLEGKFLVSPSKDTGKLKKDGGENWHSLPVPHHDHDLKVGDRVTDKSMRMERGGGIVNHRTVSSDILVCSFTNGVKPDTDDYKYQKIEFNNMPPYVVVQYIMKIRTP